MTETFTTDSGILPVWRLPQGWVWVWYAGNNGPLRSFHEIVDITVLELWDWAALIAGRHRVPTFSELFGHLIAWKRWVSVSDRLYDAIFTKCESGDPDGLRKWIIPTKPRTWDRLWSMRHDPLPETFNATVDPWTKTYGVVA